MKPVIILVALLLVSACTFSPITQKRTTRHVDLVHDVADDILRLGSERFLVDTLKDKMLKRKLRQLHAKSGAVFYVAHHEFGRDSLITLLRHHHWLTFGEIVIDIRKKPAGDLAGNRDLVKIDNSVYFRKYTLAISKREPVDTTRGYAMP